MTSMTRSDLRLILVLLLAAAGAWVMWSFGPLSGRQLVAVVRVDGRVVARLPVTGPDMRVTPVTIPRGQALIEHGQGKVRVLPLPPETCPRGICWRTGWISRTGQMIVCLPNRMTVTLEGGETDVDTVVR